MQTSDLQDSGKGCLESEEWRPVKRCCGYEVSSFGRVRSFKHSPLGRILKQNPNAQGYPQILLSNGGKTTSVRVHVLVLESFVGDRPEGKNCNHKNGIKYDNKLSNLEWVTYKENVIHSYSNGLKHGKKGMSSHRSKLTDDQIVEIRKLFSSGMPQLYISRMFNMSPSSINRICKKRAWNHIDVDCSGVEIVDVKTNDYGERHPNAKWTDGEIWLIKKLLYHGIDRKIIMKMFRMKKSNLSHISVGMTWNHVEYQPGDPHR